MSSAASRPFGSNLGRVSSTFTECERDKLTKKGEYILDCSAEPHDNARGMMITVMISHELQCLSSVRVLRPLVGSLPPLIIKTLLGYNSKWLQTQTSMRSKLRINLNVYFQKISSVFPSSTFGLHGPNPASRCLRLSLSSQKSIQNCSL